MLGKLLGCGSIGVAIIVCIATVVLVPMIDRSFGAKYRQMTVELEQRIVDLDDEAHNRVHDTYDPVVVQKAVDGIQQEADHYNAVLAVIAIFVLSLITLVTGRITYRSLNRHLRPIIAEYNAAISYQGPKAPPPQPPLYKTGVWSRGERQQCERPNRYKVDSK